jgi:hypothetical protein
MKNTLTWINNRLDIAEEKIVNSKAVKAYLKKKCHMTELISQKKK